MLDIQVLFEPVEAELAESSSQVPSLSTHTSPSLGKYNPNLGISLKCALHHPCSPVQSSANVPRDVPLSVCPQALGLIPILIINITITNSNLCLNLNHYCALISQMQGNTVSC